MSWVYGSFIIIMPFPTPATRLSHMTELIFWEKTQQHSQNQTPFRMSAISHLWITTMDEKAGMDCHVSE